MALYESEDIVYTARVVRPYLDDLLEGGAEGTKLEVDRLLERAAAGEDVDNLLLEALRRQPETRQWAQEALKPAGNIIRKYTPPPGKPHPVPATKQYTCPVAGCSFVWVRRHVGLGIPPCPRHRRELVPAE